MDVWVEYVIVVVHTLVSKKVHVLVANSMLIVTVSDAGLYMCISASDSK